MTNKQLKQLVAFVGESTYNYQELSNKFPYFNSDDWYNCIEDSFLPKPRFQNSFLETLNYDLIEPIRVNYDVAVLTFIQRPKNYYSDYKFKPTDTFKLSENGLDLLDDIKEAQHKKILNLITLFLSFVAALTGVIACIR